MLPFRVRVLPDVGGQRGGAGHLGEFGGSAGNSLRIPVRPEQRRLWHSRAGAGDVPALSPRRRGRRTEENFAPQPRSARVELVSQQVVQRQGGRGGGRQ